MKSLLDLKFTHHFVEELPADPLELVQPRQVNNACFSRVLPQPVRSPKIIGWSDALASDFVLKKPSAEGPEAAVLAGNSLLPGMIPFAACYGGHQFGNWAGQLGDGRAISLGEAKDAKGNSWEFQLKGAGPTPYSRRGDGRAVLRSSIREFVCSEAMFHLGVPTTRALSVVGTGEEVVRDMFYDGNPSAEQGAIVCRLAPSFLRFGNFEIFASRNDVETLRELTNFVLKHFYSHLGAPSADAYLALFREVCSRTAHLMAHWMRVGFVHGVMNTDNMSILGLTIDYGPYGWLDNFDPEWTPNTTDLPGKRYCYGRQPSIAVWNLAQLARSLSLLVPDQTEQLQAIIDDYSRMYEEEMSTMMASKLGLKKLSGEADGALFQEMSELLQAAETDMTIFFRGLSSLSLNDALDELPAFLNNAFYATPNSELADRWKAWLKLYQQRAKADLPNEIERTIAMNLVNPLYVPRNYLLQQAIDAAEKGDFTEISQLVEVFERPYTEQAGRESFALKRPDWARDRPGCSTLSCSS